MKAKPITERIVRGQPSYRLTSRDVELFVTRTGGHMGPVVFDRTGKRITPFSVAPWANDPAPRDPAIIRTLRGDFFCMPFGSNDTPYKGEKHPIHGETANAGWTQKSIEHTDGRHTLHLQLKTRIRKGTVDKRISLIDGQNTVYIRHRISGMSGPMDFGHHAMLAFPDKPGSGVISTSPFRFGQVFPGPFEDPAKGGYSSLKAGARFRKLDRVPMAAGKSADLTRYPARRGFEDLLMLVSDPDVPFAWTAVAFPEQRYAWFALRDPRVLGQTVLWISNGGRHYAPWSGRHVNVMGLEDVCAYFHYGLAESAGRNPMAAAGVKTSVTLNPETPLTVNYIMGVALLPRGFDRVARIEAVGRGHIRLTAESGQRVSGAAEIDFLRGAAGDR